MENMGSGQNEAEAALLGFSNCERSAFTIKLDTLQVFGTNNILKLMLSGEISLSSDELIFEKIFNVRRRPLSDIRSVNEGFQYFVHYP